MELLIVFIAVAMLYVEYVLHAEIKFMDMSLVPHTPSRMAFRNHPHVNYRSKILRMSRFTPPKFCTERLTNDKFLEGPRHKEASLLSKHFSDPT